MAFVWFAAQGVASGCADQANLTVTHGLGNTLLTQVQSPDGEDWEGSVNMTAQVNGQNYSFSFPVSVPKEEITTHVLLFSGPPTVISALACADPDGTTESPEPIGIAEKAR